MTLVATGPLEIRPFAETASVSSASIGVASTDKYGQLVRIGKAGTITKVHFHVLDVLTTGVVRVSIQGIGATGFPDGIIAQSGTVNVTSTGWKVVTLDAGRVVSRGDKFSVVYDFATWTSQRLNISSTGPTVRFANVYGVPHTGGSWGGGLDTPVVCLEYSDGTFGHLPGVSSGPMTLLSIRTDTNPDEFALKFKIPVPAKLTGVAFITGIDLLTDFAVELQDAAGAVLSGPYTVKAKENAGSNTIPSVVLFSAEITLTKDVFYRVAIKPSTSSIGSSSLVHMDALSLAAMVQMDFGADWYWSQKVDGGAWADTTTRRPPVRLIFSALDDGVVVADTTPPAAPTLSLVSEGNGQVTLTYTPPGSDYASGEIEYDGGGAVSLLAATTAGNYTVTGLSNGTRYYFSARAKDLSGNWSARSKVISGTPTTATSSGGSGSVTDDRLEHFVGLSLAKELRDANVTTTVQSQGHKNPQGEATDEWTALDVISCSRRRSRAKIWMGDVTFQVTCCARNALQRTDGQVNEPWQIASKVRFALEHKDFSIKKYGSGDAQIGILNVHEGSPRYGTTGQGDAEIHFVEVTFTGTLIR